MEEMAGEISALEWIHPIGEMKALPPFYSAMHGKSPVITKFESNRSFNMHLHKVYTENKPGVNKMSWSDGLRGSPFLKCVVSIWELPERGGGVKACQDGLGHFFPTFARGCKGLPAWFGTLFR